MKSHPSKANAHEVFVTLCPQDPMLKFKKIFSNRPFTGALLFVFLLYVFEERLFHSPQGNFYQILMTFRPPDEVRVAVFSGFMSIIFACLFVWAALGSSRAFQAIYLPEYGCVPLPQPGGIESCVTASLAIWFCG